MIFEIEMMEYGIMAQMYNLMFYEKAAQSRNGRRWRKHFLISQHV